MKVTVVPLTRLNGAAVYLSADLIATVEAHHDTVVTLVDGRCVVVAESAEQVVVRVKRYRAEVLALADQLLDDPSRMAELADAGTARAADAGAGRAADIGAGRATDRPQPTDARVLTLRPSSLAPSSLAKT